MQNETRELFNQYLDDVAELNHVASVATKFSVEPTIQQALEDVIREEVGFLQRISMPMVVEQQGEKIGLDVNSTIASNTDTTVKEREPIDPTGLTDIDKYFCQQTNFDTALRYAKLDMWRKYDDFGTRLAKAIAKQQGRDRIMIGWNGTSRSANSDRAANPGLNDVAVGWLKKIELYAPERILEQGNQAAGEIRIGKGGDYNNIDALVFDLVGEKVAEHHQDDTDLVCIIGRELLHDKYLGLVNENDLPTERLALDVIMTTKQVGGLPAVRVPFFPKRGLLITSLDNLSIYLQEKSLRRHIIDNPKRDRVEDYQSMNMDYMIEDFTRLAHAKSASIKVRTNDPTEATPVWG